MESPVSKEQAVEATRTWLEKDVIGLNLCPFAQAVHVAGRIRYVVSDAETAKALRGDLLEELLFLKAADPEQVDTTLLIHPRVLNDFYEFNDFLDIADDVLKDLGLRGDIQIASFHPHYQFAETEPDDVSNRTNRSPYPTLHLLREASVEKALENYPDADEIPQRNIETMRRLYGSSPKPPG
ncbi:MAG TPA: DUF1415 domain-containing protein [Planctomycetota bacterium]|jgi:hypothetical protein|nr:DUF1415 domain-containing protein [Planctomycetota bacterium]